MRILLRVPRSVLWQLEFDGDPINNLVSSPIVIPMIVLRIHDATPGTESGSIAVVGP